LGPISFSISIKSHPPIRYRIRVTTDKRRIFEPRVETAERRIEFAERVTSGG